MSHDILYNGYVFADVETRESVPMVTSAVAKLFGRREIKNTRKRHPLFARGFANKLTFSTYEDHVVFSSGGQILLHVPVRKIFTSHCENEQLLVFVCRAGMNTSLKVMSFTLPSTSAAQELQSSIVKLSLVTPCGARQPVVIRGLPESASSTDDAAHRRSGSHTPDASDDEGEEASDAPYVPAASIRSCGSSFGVRAHPCSVCNSDEGLCNAWLALKSCGHHFHRTCMTQWRSEGHNVCPLCRVPISTSSFRLRQLCGFYTGWVPSAVELQQMAEEQVEREANLPTILLQSNGTHIAFLDPVTRAARLRTVGLFSVRKPILLGRFIALVVALGSNGKQTGHIVQLFEVPVELEAAATFEALCRACVRR